ncbi:MAG: Methyltransferase type 11 [Frankiales bacterium]|nr:Methyltransferase type 11 [Frankiales bacterium]
MRVPTTCLMCPVCASEIEDRGPALRCLGCSAEFPKHGDVPVLIDQARSLFSHDDILRIATSVQAKKPPPVRLPGISANLAVAQALKRFAGSFPDEPSTRILIIGGGPGGAGAEALAQTRFTVVNTDVVVRADVDYAVDGHSLPFQVGTFDGVVIQAVLEHVLDPEAVVAEIHRVLRPGGLVYAETPFMQQVHGGAYDFVRFTQLGHRRLFRAFEEVESGQVASAGTTLAWSLSYFFTSFARSPRSWHLIRRICQVLLFWLKHTDRLLAKNPASWDGASCSYFIGRRSDSVLSDKELLQHYRGFTY